MENGIHFLNTEPQAVYAAKRQCLRTPKNNTQYKILALSKADTEQLPVTFFFFFIWSVLK